MGAQTNRRRDDFANPTLPQPESRERGSYGALISSALATAGVGAIALRQVGAVKNLPDPPSSLFDSNRVVMSPQSRKLLGIPDGILGLGSYGTTLGLAWWQYRHRSRVSSLALAAKTAVDVSMALSQSLRQWPDFRCLCSWCLLPVTCSVVTAFLVAPEATAALRELFGDGTPRERKRQREFA